MLNHLEISSLFHMLEALKHIKKNGKFKKDLSPSNFRRPFGEYYLWN
jgi:hypothetical protein